MDSVLMSLHTFGLPIAVYASGTKKVEEREREGKEFNDGSMLFAISSSSCSASMISIYRANVFELAENGCRNHSVLLFIRFFTMREKKKQKRFYKHSINVSNNRRRTEMSFFIDLASSKI